MEWFEFVPDKSYKWLKKSKVKGDKQPEGMSSHLQSNQDMNHNMQ